MIRIALNTPNASYRVVLCALLLRVFGVFRHLVGLDTWETWITWGVWINEINQQNKT